jgi:hypothetical protein
MPKCNTEQNRKNQTNTSGLTRAQSFFFFELENIIKASYSTRSTNRSKANKIQGEKAIGQWPYEESKAKATNTPLGLHTPSP